jgi:hypothetical protein
MFHDKSRFLKTPLYNGALIKTRTVRDDNPLFHSVLHCYSEKYIKSSFNKRVDIVSELNEKLIKQMWKETIDHTLQLTIFNSVITELQSKPGYDFFSHKSIKKVVLNKIDNMTNSESFQIMRESLYEYIDNLLSKAKVDKDSYLTSLIETIDKTISDVKYDYYKNFFKHKREEMHNLVYDDKTIRLIEDQFKVDIYFLTKEGLPLNKKNNNRYKKGIVLISDTFEVVGKVSNGKAKRVFKKSSKLIKNILSYKEPTPPKTETEQNKALDFKDESPNRLVSAEYSPKEEKIQIDSPSEQLFVQSNSDKEEKDIEQSYLSNKDIQLDSDFPTFVQSNKEEDDEEDLHSPMFVQSSKDEDLDDLQSPTFVQSNKDEEDV